MRAELSGYGVNCAYRYFPITRTNNYGHEWTQSSKFWTAIIHKETCRFVKRNADGRAKVDYSGERGLQSLAQYGIGAPTRMGQDTVWLGCRTCGTAMLPNEHWKAIAQAAIDGGKAAEAARRAHRDAEQKVEAAQDARKWAIIDARNAWIDEHWAEIAAVEQAAAQQWDAEHPELLALITEKEGAR